METTNLTKIIMSVVVGVVLFAAILVPVVSESVQTHETFDNTQYAYYQMKELETGDSWVLTDGSWYYDDVLVTDETNSGVSIIATPNLVIRQDGLTRGTTYTSNSTSSAETVVVDDVTKLLLNSSKYVTYTEGYGAVADGGDYVLKTYTDSAYVNGDTALWVSGYTALASGSSSQVFIHIEGTIDDGVTIEATPIYNGTATDLVVGDYTVNYEEVDGYEDLYLVSSIVFDVTGTYNEETVTTTFTYSTFVLPKEVTAELSVHLNESEINLVNIVPLLVLVGLVLGSIGMILARRD